MRLRRRFDARVQASPSRPLSHRFMQRLSPWPPTRSTHCCDACAIGWMGRQGVSDVGNQFHYYRLTPDNRILWGGYDAIYHWRGKVSAEYDSRLATWAKLAEHFFDTFPTRRTAIHSYVGRRHRHLQPSSRPASAGGSRTVSPSSSARPRSPRPWRLRPVAPTSSRST